MLEAQEPRLSILPKRKGCMESSLSLEGYQNISWNVSGGYA